MKLKQMKCPHHIQHTFQMFNLHHFPAFFLSFFSTQNVAVWYWHTHSSLPVCQWWGHRLVTANTRTLRHQELRFQSIKHWDSTTLQVRPLALCNDYICSAAHIHTVFGWPWPLTFSRSQENLKKGMMEAFLYWMGTFVFVLFFLMCWYQLLCNPSWRLTCKATTTKLTRKDQLHGDHKKRIFFILSV